VLRDHDLGAALVEVGDNVVAVESLVGDQRAEFDAVDQRRNADRVEALSRQQDESNEIAERVGEGRGSWSSCPLWRGRWPGSESPFCALAVTMDLDDGGVDHGVLHVRLIRDCIEKLFEKHPLSPSLDTA
jgi:hypothetical protein